MRVVHTGELNFALPTGSGMAVWSLVTGLRSLGCEIDVLRPYGKVSDGERQRFLEAGIGISLLSGSRREALLAAFAHGRRIVAMRPDLVHFHSGFLPLHPIIAHALRSHGIPYLVTPHGAFHPEVLRRGRWKKSAYLHLLEIRYLRHAAAVVALTEAEKLDVAAIVPGQRIDVIPNAIDADSLALCNLAREARRTRQGGAMQAMFLGRYDAWTKGLDFLCQLVGRLRERGLNMELSLYGTQDPRPERQREFQELANRQLPYVRINSAVYGEEKAAALATCDVYFQTSRYEAFGISVVEAMAVGVPVVITDTMHLSSVIQQADAGFVIPFDLERATTILLDALAKPNALLQKGEHGRQYVMQNFTSESVATRTIEVYQDALAANKNVSAARPGSGSRA